MDLAVTPHMLIRGSTGSGKTYLVKSVIVQAQAKNYKVYLIDLTGGIDFPRSWQEAMCDYADNPQSALEMLCQLTYILNSRKNTFQQRGQPCAPLDEYNRRYPDEAMACDEIGELIDTTGLDKPSKESVTVIVGYLSTIARLGRAFGIHWRPSGPMPTSSLGKSRTIVISGFAEEQIWSALKSY